MHTRNEVAAIDNQLRQTLENISDGFFMLDHDWRFVFVNSQAEQLLQMSSEQLQGFGYAVSAANAGAEATSRYPNLKVLFRESL
ncbi:PAS domain-containing protein [Pseudidiomarina sp. E22-M8]|uniref:PAS domain-containing protein n=1 Tax=Pseudidiomarina sp. E22-M8 TaxID=3424768 RepID=UPI00403C0549